TQPPPTPTQSVEPTATPIPFDGTAAEEEGYWYSRYNLGNLVFRSALGETFKPDPEIIKSFIQLADANPDDGDTAAPKKGVAPLRAVYASGDPHYIQKLDVNDFGTQRWDPASFDTTITARAMGWTMIKEIEWSKQFHVDNHFGTPQDDFGAQWRFVGLLLNAEAKQQGLYALQNLKNEQGLIADSDGQIDWSGQWVMLEAYSDLAAALKADALPHSASNRYHNPQQASVFGGAADMLFASLTDRQPADIEELSLAIQALTWYAATTDKNGNQADALQRITRFGDMLAAAQPANATERAFVIRGLIEAYRTTGNDTYLAAAAAAFEAMAADFNPETGAFDSQNTYTIDNVAVIMGALNSLKFFGGNAVDAGEVEDIFTNFFLNAVNKSGLQQSVPPIPVAKGEFEQDEPPIFFGYPTIPKPPMAGGDFGIAPVFAAEVTWNGSGWEVTDSRFDTAGAMHASNEFIWFHNDEVNGFPEVVALPPSATGVRNGLAQYDATAAEEEGYWYSRYNLLSLTLQSGNGETFMPPKEMLMAAIKMVDADPSDGDTVVPPVNPAPLRIVYAGGDPHLAQALDPSDFGTLRWVGGDTRITTEATAWTIVKELEWAKQFHVDNHFGTPDAPFGAQQRFVGMMMALMPKMQVKAWMEEADRFDNSLAGDYAMLLALSDGAGVYGAETLPHSAGNRYADPDAAAMFAAAADQLLQKVLASEPTGVRDLSIGIQALVWYAANTSNADNRALALDKIAAWGETLAQTPHSLPVEHATVARGLIEAGRITGNDTLLDAAAKHLGLLLAAYVSETGAFSGQDTYTADDAGTIMGALNAGRLFLGDRIDQAKVEAVFAGFFEGVVNLGGLQISAPPINLFKAPFEQEEPPIFLRYPALPVPPMAGGDFGIAPVLAASTTWDGSRWTADTAHFDTAGAMHSINEFIWFHNDEVNGFPELP
ncbi:MAG: hypothetical protein D6775_06350, partial [Caldilineae bacterium]